MTRVLVLSPHTDDGELGAGGTIAQLACQGAELDMVAFSTGTASREEAKAAGDILGAQWVSVHEYKTRRMDESRQEILDEMIRLRDVYKPKVIFCPSSWDRHQDHEVIRAEAWRAFRAHASILGYELPWSCQAFNAQMLVPLDKPAIAKKAVSMLKYTSQRDKPYTSAAAIMALARVRGIQAGVLYAEAFEVIRWRGHLQELQS